MSDTLDCDECGRPVDAATALSGRVSHITRKGNRSSCLRFFCSEQCRQDYIAARSIFTSQNLKFK